jgi:CRP-like cAMP-binding protein
VPELARIESVVFLQSVDFFSACTAEEVLRLASIARERQVPAGAQLFEARERAETLYCVVRGSVEITEPGLPPHVAGPLQTVGLVDILSGRLRSGTAVAVAPTLLLEIDADDFFDLLSNNIEMVKSLFRHLIHQIDSSREQRT